jgi:hypothetical protein
MEFFRFSQNVWGQEILLGMSWEPLWVPVAAAFVFIAAHLVIRALKRRR